MGKMVLPAHSKWWLSHQPKFHTTLTVKILGDKVRNNPIFFDKPLNIKKYCYII